jgi:hypothetical protein
MSTRPFLGKPSKRFRVTRKVALLALVAAVLGVVAALGLAGPASAAMFSNNGGITINDGGENCPNK